MKAALFQPFLFTRNYNTILYNNSIIIHLKKMINTKINFKNTIDNTKIKIYNKYIR